MTERKTPRNTTELPVTVAIARLRELLGDLKAEHEELDMRGQERARKILFRVPAVVREHVAKEGGFPTAMAEMEPPSNDSAPSRTDDVDADVVAGMTGAGEDSDRSWLDAPVEPTERIEVEDGKARRVGAQRAK